jgi:acetyl-CoA carboxylase biotin carboxylase subunit
MNIQRVLIANRGEIAVRLIRTCRDLGIETVLAASAADTGSLAARLADKTICIGPPPPAQSYLNIPAIIAAAQSAGADAVHPGYGFLAENANLARACHAADLVFIGPTEAQLIAVGDKLKAREHARAAGIPVLTGGTVTSIVEALKLGHAIGWPVLIKAVGGGGGRGMKIVTEPAQLGHTMELAMAEAEAAFADSRVYLERYVPHGRHVEVQILGDGTDIIHLGTRDCSIQRRYQKLIEEAPAPVLPEQLRSAIHAAAVRFGRHLEYRGLGTVEFLVDKDRGEFYFLEMNARIQVEHPVTEAITGLDLVARQISVAEGRPLALRQEDVIFNGHAIECRINAEDCGNNFHPSPGTVKAASFPAGEGIRVDTHIESGSVVPPFYDSLLGKLIVHAADRAAAIRMMAQALQVCRIDGIHSNIIMHKLLIEDPEFGDGGVDTGYFSRFMEQATARIFEHAAAARQVRHG